MDAISRRSGFMTADHGDGQRVRLHYLDWGGEGPALLFLPGLGCNAYIYDLFGPRFTDGFHVMGLTRRGHGDSDYPSSGYDIDTLTEDIRQFLDYQGIERASLAGHSMAGIELTRFAARYPERIDKLIFLDAIYGYTLPGFLSGRKDNPMRSIQIPGADKDFVNYEDLAAQLRFAYPALGRIWSELFDEHLRHEMRAEADGTLVDKVTDEISQAIQQTMTTYEREYEKIQAPTLAICTLRDAGYVVAPDYMDLDQQNAVRAYFDTVTQPWNLESIDLFRRNVAHARVVTFPGHHYCFIEQAEQVYREMRAFLEGERGISEETRIIEDRSTE